MMGKPPATWQVAFKGSAALRTDLNWAEPFRLDGEKAISVALA